MRSSLVVATAALVLAACSQRAPAATVTPQAEAATPSPSASPTAPALPTTPAGAGVATFEAERAYEHTRVLAVDIGERLSGTPGELEAANYAAGHLRNLGYDARVIPFTFDGDRFATAELSVGSEQFEARPIEGSAGAQASGPLVFAGLGRPADIPTTGVNGAIAVVDRGQVEFGAKVRNLRDAGAVAVIVVNSADELMRGATLGGDSELAVVGVRQGDRAALIEAAGRGALAEVSTGGTSTDSVNVLATAPGSDGCPILVGGHHDTVPGTSGANDNASGVGHVLELARAMAADGLDPGMCFATFGGEESGLYGSDAMAAAMAAEGGLPEVMVNLDVTGLGMPVEAIGDEDLVERAIAVAAAAGIDVIASSLPANAGSDHMSFQDRNVPVLFFTSGDFATIHTPADTFDALSLESFEAVGKAALAVIEDLYRELARP